MNQHTRRHRITATSSWASIICLAVLIASLAPISSAQQADQTIPTLVNFSGALTDINGKPLSGVVGVTFSLYKDEQGGSPLWLESQNVQPDKTGHYSVLLGSTKSTGLPTDLFASAEARWLGVQPEGQVEQPRVLLLSVPYAMKAGDAETVGGLPPSAFVLANGAQGNASAKNTGSTAAGAKNAVPPANPAVTGKGAVDYIPMWDTTSDIVDSIMFQKSLQIGVNTITPAATLDVNGKTDVRDTLTLFPKSTDSTLAINGTAFKVDSTGKVTFVSGQTFSGAGTITGVTTATGSGLSGGGTTGTLSLKVPSAGITNAMLANSKITLNASTAGGLTVPGAMNLGSTYTVGLKTCSANQVLQYTGTAWNCASAGAGTITGVTAGTDLTGGGTTGSVTLNLDTTKVPLLAANNTFSGTQTINNSVTITNNSLSSLNLTNSGAGNGIQASANNASGFAVYGGNSGSGTGVGGNGSFAGVYGTSSGAGGYGVYGFNNNGSGNGVRGIWASASNRGTGTVDAGVWGDTSGGIGVVGTTDGPEPGVFGWSETGSGVDATSSSGDGVFATSSTGSGVFSYSTSYVGTYGEYFIPSQSASGFGSTGVWGDTGETGSIGVLGGADDGNALFGLNNSGGHETLYVANNFNQGYYGVAAKFAGPGSATWCEIYGDDFTPGTGDLLCAGTKPAAVPVDGNRMVRLYAVEAAENWFEDAGMAQLAEGKALVSLDHVFAQTVNGDGDCHVFLTPNGECEGLYIASKGAQGFEVRELHAGHSNISFDYRLMARRKGYEKVRMEDVTAHFETAKRNAAERAAQIEANKVAHKTPQQNHQPPLNRKTAVAEPASVKLSLPSH